jgi:hypothetical protein
MPGPQRFRLRAPASGREVVLALDNPEDNRDHAYYDRVTGERLEVVSKLVPLSDSHSNLPRSPETVRICPHCEELVGIDLSDCPYCGRRLPALGEPDANRR